MTSATTAPDPARPSDPSRGPSQDPTHDLSGRTAVVTGGTSGIGLATASLLLQRGAAVAINGRDPERLAAAQAQLLARHPGARLLARSADVH